MIIFEYGVVGNLLTATDSLTGTIAGTFFRPARWTGG